MTKPVIGITGNFGDYGCQLAEGYYLSVVRAGAVALILPPYIGAGDDEIDRMLDSIDGLMLSGGADINPLLLGEEPSRELRGINVRRDDIELRLVRRAFERQIPILGICRGIQVLVAALGGTVIQDIYSATDKSLLKHSQEAERWCATHTVSIKENSILKKIFADSAISSLPVNSYHHQAVGETGPHLRVSACAKDGIIEAVESSECKSIIGVQWHPECFILNNDDCMMPLFRWLVDESNEYRAALRLHDRQLTLDSHEDTPMFFDQDIEFGKRDKKILVNLPYMDDGHLDVGIQVAYLPQGDLTNEAHLAATSKAHALLDGIERMVAPFEDRIVIARTPLELYVNKNNGKHSVMMGIENCYAFGTDIGNVEAFRSRGVVYGTLCHNGCNSICDSARPKENDHLWGGVSPFGEKVIREMNRVGMMVDLSHAAESSFYDALELSSVPIVCSHSNAKTLCNHPRNLSDDQLRALAAKGGVAQVNLYHGFLSEGDADIYDVMRHLNHMVAIMGVEHVGIGTDFDGDGGVHGLANAAELVNFTRQLLKHRYTEEQIAGIWGGNFLRVMLLAQSKQDE